MEHDQKQQTGRWEAFHRPLAQAFDEHPNEVEVIKEHLLKQVEGRPNVAAQFSRQMLIDGSRRHYELLVSVLESDRCWGALEVLSAEIRKKFESSGKFSGNPLPIFVAAVIGGLIGIDFRIWEAHFTGGDGGICL